MHREERSKSKKSFKKKNWKRIKNHQGNLKLQNVKTNFNKLDKESKLNKTSSNKQSVTKFLLARKVQKSKVRLKLKTKKIKFKL